MICNKCGSEIKEEVVFCTNCGSRIEAEATEAQTETFTKEEANNEGGSVPVEAAAVQNARKEQAKHIWGNILHMIKSSFKKPVTMLEEFADEKYFISGIVFLTAKDILTALLIALTITSQINMVLGGYAGFVSELSGTNSFSTFMSVFSMLLVVVLLCDAAGGLLTYAAGKIFGTTVSLKKWIGAYSYASVWSFYSGVLGGLISLIRIPVISSIIALVCMLVLVCVIVKAFEVVLGMKGDSSYMHFW